MIESISSLVPTDAIGDLYTLRQPTSDSCAVTAATLARVATCAATSQARSFELRRSKNPAWWPPLYQSLVNRTPRLEYADQFLEALTGRPATMQLCDVRNPAYLWLLGTRLLPPSEGVAHELTAYTRQHRSALTKLRDTLSARNESLRRCAFVQALPAPRPSTAALTYMLDKIYAPGWATAFWEEKIADQLSTRKPTCLSTRVTLPRRLAMRPGQVTADAWRATRDWRYGWSMLRNRSVAGMTAHHCYAVVGMTSSARGKRILLLDPAADAKKSAPESMDFADVLACTIAFYLGS